MMHAAYEINGAKVESQRFYEVACDPHRSVVVEACAGAGKTWMLVSRILRALIDGVPPGQILAITFTKKAAGEMRERLHDWLRMFAQATDAQRMQELQWRGLTADQAAHLAPRLQALYGEWLQEGHGVDIHTIHGWFSRLVKAAPLDVLTELGLPPELNLIEDTAELWPELWGRFLRRVDASRPARLAQPTAIEADDGAADESPYDAFMQVVREVGRFNTEAWLQTALANRLELHLADEAGRLQDGIEPASEWADTWQGLSHPVQALQRQSVQAHFRALAVQLGSASGAMARNAGVAIEQALGLADGREQAQALCKALLTDKGEPRKRLGDLADLEWAQAWLIDLQQATLQQEAHELHGQMVCLSRLLFDTYARLKTERGLADMVDLELAAARLLGDPVMSGWIQQRLDSQVRQLLMDEFQDTSPLQWQTLRSWLSAYAGAGGGGSGQQPISVFLVGDPKQSIYRFRRADPRVFEAAKAFVLQGLDGVLLACDHTRRNAPGVIELLNKVMGQAHGEGSFPGFRPHTTASQDQALVRVLPTVPRSAVNKPEGRPGWRDSLLTPRELAHTTLKELEAAQVAAAVSDLIRHEGIKPSQVFVLSRRRAMLALVAQALDEHGVPHLAPEDTLLIDTPEVRDLVAVLDVLVSPHHDLALAHALKSPLFGATDEDLLCLAHQARQGDAAQTWWATLMSLQASSAWPASLARAADLLCGWADLAKVAPPHDLLERVVTDGQLRARLVACVPASRRAQALFHVDALLSHTLQMDAGRDATPYRWVRALKRLPLNLPPRVQSDAVQLLTIHGAKGLEAKVVFMVDTDPEPPRRDSYALMVDWPEGEHCPRRCAFIRSQGKPPPSLAQTLDADRLADQREELNALYVALTRAREQLVFSRTEPRGQGQGSWWQRLVSSQAIDPQSCNWPQAEVPALPCAAQGVLGPAESLTIKVSPPLASRLTSDQSASGQPDEPSLEQQLGQVVHRVLEWLTLLPLPLRDDGRIHRAARAAAQELGLPTTQVSAAQALATGILRAPGLQAWLDPAQLAWAGNEVALHDQGQLLRMDRLVARQTPSGREWWVLDYKLQHRPDSLESHRQQLRRYVQAVSAQVGHEPVRAAFISGAGEWIPLD